MSTPAVGSVELPLNEHQTESLQRAVDGMSSAQLHWVSGYIAGLAANSNGLATLPAADADDSATLTILFGSQTGNGQSIAENSQNRRDHWDSRRTQQPRRLQTGKYQARTACGIRCQHAW